MLIYMHRAKWARKALGGGMRQSGIIAAPMRVALKEVYPLLKQDHARAQKITQGKKRFSFSFYSLCCG